MESAGARVVPIPWEADNKTLSHLFNSVNGLLLPGGYHPIYKHSKSPSFDKNKLAETTAFLIKKKLLKQIEKAISFLFMVSV